MDKAMQLAAAHPDRAMKAADMASKAADEHPEARESIIGALSHRVSSLFLPNAPSDPTPTATSTPPAMDESSEEQPNALACGTLAQESAPHPANGCGQRYSASAASQVVNGARCPRTP